MFHTNCISNLPIRFRFHIEILANELNGSDEVTIFEEIAHEIFHTKKRS